ncbi:MAG TPA: nitroreductase family protein [Methylomirabilota bacterium]|nr:nitroreductase family protein [Methylomirabilota bacterium]
METWAAIDGVRVVRKFTDEPLKPEHLERILHAGRRTASSKNEQTWAFVVVTERDRLRELTAVGRYADHLAGAAAVVALVTPDESGPHVRTTMWDLGRVAQNMVLAAWELGIGSVPATAHNHKVAARLLGLPEDRRCDFLLSFGYPADPAKLTAPNKAGGRKAFEEVVREERW